MEQGAAARAARPFCLCLLDIDFFKRINDTYGHAAGDASCANSPRTVQQQIRETDAFGRYGGEEFLLMLPETSLEDALPSWPNACARPSEALRFPDIDGGADDLGLDRRGPVPQRRNHRPDRRRADEALYLAKSGGRNRVVFYGQTGWRARRRASRSKCASRPSSLAGVRAGRRRRRQQPVRPLTGLLSRRVLRDRLGHAMARTPRRARLVGLMLLNVNKFKEINEALGYDGGDAVLVQIAHRVRACLRESDTMVRWGGDEFIVVLEDLAQRSDAQQVAEKILDRVRHAAAAGGRESFVSLSIGIAIFPGAGCRHRTLLKRADTAMTRAKSWGENSVQLYSSEAPRRRASAWSSRTSLRERPGRTAAADRVPAAGRHRQRPHRRRRSADPLEPPAATAGSSRAASSRWPKKPA